MSKHSMLDKDPRFSNYKIGKFTYGYKGSPIIEWENKEAVLEIGSFCSIARGVNIYLGGNHHTEWVTTSPLNQLYNIRKDINAASTKGNVIIGNDVWIGADVTILSGVTIGDGVVIGTKSIISKSIPPYSVAVGNPAQVVKKRFSDDSISKLLKIKWWDWPDEKIRENISLLLSPNVDDFINKHYNQRNLI
jgi:acetyltransferase-like isoleucine patch superfamily enzyme